MSILTTAVVHCDECGDALDDGSHGTRTKAEAWREARKNGMVRRRAVDGKLYEFCADCDRERSGSTSVPRYGRARTSLLTDGEKTR